MVLRKIHPILSLVNNSLVDLPSPSNISYMWNFGSLLGLCLMIQIVSGLFLAMHFSSDTSLAFSYVSHIIRDCNYGWLIRNIHANGASLFFILIYIHIGRGIYYSSFHFLFTWFSGVLILLILMGTAFLGYVLPWGQMSFWGATVITNLLSAIPYIGMDLTYWIWGGFSVSNATLTRFFSLHFILPLLLSVFVIIHIVFLHETGSSNPLGTPFNLDKITFNSYFVIKDLFGVLMLMFFFLFIIFLNPNFFFDPENYIPANSLVTPPHIQPEWYFLFAYAILRSIPNKLGGVIGLFMSIIILLILPLVSKNKFNFSNYFIIKKMMFWYLVNIFILLTYFGACPVEDPYIMLSQLYTFLYFLYFLFLPLVV
uniref:Cytochrome b n=1 Tax=Echinolaelaps traubi TaxID=3119979 RepID=A0AAU6PB64_9ACAR